MPSACNFFWVDLTQILRCMCSSCFIVDLVSCSTAVKLEAIKILSDKCMCNWSILLKDLKREN